MFSSILFSQWVLKKLLKKTRWCFWLNFMIDRWLRSFLKQYKKIAPEKSFNLELARAQKGGEPPNWYQEVHCKKGLVDPQIK